jgi:hypothetical protein
MSIFSQAYPNHCVECGELQEVCDCGGEGKEAQAMIEAEWEEQRNNKK